jgi:hypothetical protein
MADVPEPHGPWLPSNMLPQSPSINSTHAPTLQGSLNNNPVLGCAAPRPVLAWEHERLACTASDNSRTRTSPHRHHQRWARSQSGRIKTGSVASLWEGIAMGGPMKKIEDRMVSMEGQVHKSNSNYYAFTAARRRPPHGNIHTYHRSAYSRHACHS